MALSASELAEIQADTAAAACDKACTIQRATRTPEPQGGATLTWNTTSPADLLVGMAEPTAGQLTNYGYLVGSLAAWQIKLPIGTDIKENDHLIIEGETLEVVKDLTPRSYPALITVLATELK